MCVHIAQGGRSLALSESVSTAGLYREHSTKTSLCLQILHLFTWYGSSLNNWDAVVTFSREKYTMKGKNLGGYCDGNRSSLEEMEVY